MASLAEVLAKRKQEKEAKLAALMLAESTYIPVPDTQLYTDSLGNKLNIHQSTAVNNFKAKKTFCLIGAAGTGKTTAVRAMTEEAIRHDIIQVLPDDCNSSWLKGNRAIAFVAFTNRAVNRLRRSLPAELKKQALTIHKLLEYAPEAETFLDAESGEIKERKVFKPALRPETKVVNEPVYIVIEESSMVSVDLHQQIIDAFPNATLVYLGDLNQLKPVYGNSILGFKLTHLDVVELKEVYRQALGSQIVQFAYDILGSKRLTQEIYDKYKTPNESGNVDIYHFNGDPSAVLACKQVIGAVLAWWEQGKIDFSDTQILVPHNENFGQITINKFIAQACSNKAGNPTHEIHTGSGMDYYAVGDKLMYDRSEYYIADIRKNPYYSGEKGNLHVSLTLDRYGHDTHKSKDPFQGIEEISPYELVEGEVQDKEARKREASHILTLTPADSQAGLTNVEVKTSGDYAKCELCYAMTVHKAQGCEWKHVIFCAHKSHANMLSRELVYTAVTRAMKQLTIFASKTSLSEAPMRKTIKGDTLEDKIQYFVGLQKSEAARGFDPIENKRIS